ncbi:MAG: hypothetical protein ACTS27_01290 [Phycisphaerales bacterium]
MNSAELERWAKGLRAAADRAEPFCPRSGDDRTSVRPLGLWIARGEPSRIAAPNRVDPDAFLWWRLVVNDAEAALRKIADARGTPRSPSDAGALFPQGAYTAIEVWTEAELSSLQALWWLCRMQAGAPLRDVMFDSARWHLENTQPDNATNRPWAIPVFLEMAVDEQSPDARLFAETLLHNALAGQERSEPFSGLILRDAADAVDVLMKE